MSSMSSVAGLSKYITTLPKTEYTIIGILIISVLIGSVDYIILFTPQYGILEALITGALFGLVV